MTYQLRHPPSTISQSSKASLALRLHASAEASEFAPWACKEHGTRMSVFTLQALVLWEESGCREVDVVSCKGQGVEVEKWGFDVGMYLGRGACVGQARDIEIWECDG